MANLFNRYIYQTYKSIVGIGQSGTSGLIPGQIQPLTDGEGNELPIRVSDTEVEVDLLTSKNLSIENYGQVIDINGNWVGPSSGLSGTSGTSGTSGANGSSGQSGSSGTAGTSGINGAQGIAGSAGTSGTNGSSGTAGTSGINGAQGIAGSAGTSGTSGTSGMTGQAGTAGTSGTSGVSNDGTSGTSGTSGANGIASGRNYFFNQSQASDIVPYKVLATEPSGAAQQIITKNLTALQQNVLVQEFITPELGFTIIPGGVQRFHLHFLKPAENDHVETYVTLALANSAGVPYGPDASTNKALIGWVDNVNPVEATIDLVLPTTNVLATDRVIIKVYLDNEDNTAHSVSFYTEGTANYSYVITSVAAASGTSGTSGTNGTSGLTGTSGTSGVSGSSGTSGTTPINTIASSGPSVITNIWSGTQAEYTALGTYSNQTLYFID